MKNIHFILLAFVGLSLTIACANTSMKQESSIQEEKKLTADIKPLLDREGDIANLPEWEGIKEKATELFSNISQGTENKYDYLYLAAIYMQEARITGEHPYYYPAAMQLVDEVINSDAKESLVFQALVMKGSVLLSQHNFEEAMEVGKMALKIESFDAKVYGILCDAHVEMGNYEEAVKMADKMVKIRPDLRSYSRISYLREIYGDYEGAIKAMKMAINAGVPGHENTSWCQYTLGTIYEDRGDLVNAKKYYQQSFQQRPNYAFGLAGLGNIELKNKNYDKALDLTQKAIKVIPEFSFYQQLASIYDKIDKKEEFQNIVKELGQMLTEDQESGHNMNLEIANIALELENNPQRALKFAEKEYQIRPNNRQVCESMAIIQATIGNHNLALNLIEKSAVAEKISTNLTGWKGWILYQEGKKSQGKKLMQQSIKLNPFSEEKWVHNAKDLGIIDV